jgi:hypothetical protein
MSIAHNTIVAARAGKDLVSCVCSGMLTIGPRFGGAIDDAARFFYDAVKDDMFSLSHSLFGHLFLINISNSAIHTQNPTSLCQLHEAEGNPDSWNRSPH